MPRFDRHTPGADRIQVLDREGQPMAFATACDTDQGWCDVVVPQRVIPGADGAPLAVLVTNDTGQPIVVRVAGEFSIRMLPLPAQTTDEAEAPAAS